MTQPKKARLSREERLALARAEQRTKNVENFKLRIARDKAKLVVREPWDVVRLSEHVDGPLFGRQEEAYTMLEMLQRAERSREQLANALENLGRAVAEAQLVVSGERNSYSTSPVQGRGNEVDALYARYHTERELASMYARTLGLYCPALTTQAEQRKRDQRVSMTVAQVGDTWTVVRDGRQVAGFSQYATEEDAWVAFAASVGGEYWADGGAL